MTNRLHPRRALCLVALLSGLVGAPLMAQQAHGQHQPALEGAVASAPVAAASKPVARKPRPQMGISAALAPDGALWVVGLTPQGQLFVQHAPAFAPGAGPKWEAPRVLDTSGDPISADGENHPKLVFGPHGTVLIAYTQPLAKPNTGFVRMLRSLDAGKTFSPPFTVHADRQEITHRFESIGFDAKGALHTIWIDKRDLEAAPKVGNKSSYRGAAIYRNVSTDGGLTFGPDIKVADHSCECCRIALGLGADGVLRAMWRHVFEPNVRDHAVAALTPATTPAATPTAPPIVRATYDEWRVDGCPHHGPGLVAAGEGFHAVWFGIRQHGADQGPGVRYARLKSDGSPVAGTVQRVPDDRAEHASVAAHGSRVAVVWRSVDGMTSTLKAWLSLDGGQTFRVATLGQASGDNDFPRLVQQGQRMAVVWRQAKEVQVYELAF
ncbi:MAG: exo-alpha-sialidase [Rhodoferax sp.]|nr:exo-alpha-sialidase [Rhodoferax sp.]